MYIQPYTLLSIPTVSLFHFTSYNTGQCIVFIDCGIAVIQIPYKYVTTCKLTKE